MEQDIYAIQSLTGDENLAFDYLDDDLMIVDNVRLFADPQATRTAMNVIVCCQSGRAQALLGEQDIELGENQILVLPPGVVMEWLMVTPDFEFKAVFFTNSLLHGFLREKISVWNEVMFIYRRHVVTMRGSDIEFFNYFYNMLRLSLDIQPPSPYHSDIIRLLFSSALISLCGTLKTMLPDGNQLEKGRPESHFQRFLDLLSSEHGRRRSVESYASELCITPKYLSSLCKQESGKTAMQWIREHLHTEIRYYLKQTDLSMKQISDRLGFPNPSFFGKYVKENFGMTPIQFRQKG